MTCYFVGGAAGSALAGLVHARAGWQGVCTLGATLAALLCLVGAADVVRARRAAAASVPLTARSSVGDR
jgi:hypothetical protein